MGNSTFSIPPALLSSEHASRQAKQRQKAFIESLGNSYPFGDDELERLLFFHEQIVLHHDPIEGNSFSFLQCLGVAATSYIPGVDCNTLQTKVKFVEKNILPSNFGNSLEKIAFVDQENSPSPSSNSPTSPLGMSDEFHLDSIVSSYEKNPHKKHQLEKFLKGMAESCGRRGGRYVLGVLFQCCSKDDNKSFADVTELINVIYRIALASVYLSNKIDLTLPEGGDLGSPKGLIQSLMNASERNQGNNSFAGNNFYYDSPSSGISESNSHNNQEILSQKGKITKDAFFQWAEDTAPLLSSVLPTFFHELLFSDRAFPPSRTPFLFPYFFDGNTSFLLGGKNKSQVYPLLFSCACMSNSLGGMWYRLFSSDADGLSFNRLLKAILGYAGPTLLIVSSTCGGTFGAFTSSRWMENRDFYGNSDCFLYQLEPTTNVCRPKSGASSPNYMYCNPQARSKGYDGLAHGIGFGGDTSKPRLFITETLDECVATSNDLTFMRGELLAPSSSSPSSSSSNTQRRQRNSFEIESMEVWGVGGDGAVKEALGQRAEHRQIMDANIKKARKVDKAQFLDDFKSGLIESKAFQHRGQIRGNEGASIDNEHGENAYKYE